MRSPDDVIPGLTEEEKRYIAAVETEIETWLKDHPEYVLNTVTGVKKRQRDLVWQQLVDNANNAGWTASLQGAMLTIKPGRR